MHTSIEVLEPLSENRLIQVLPPSVAAVWDWPFAREHSNCSAEGICLTGGEGELLNKIQQM
jgi:hypothetical protein